MYSSGGGPSLFERCGGLSCMSWQLGPLQRIRRLWRLQQLRVVILVPVQHLVEQRGRPDQRRRAKSHFKAKVGESQFGRVVHACGSSGTRTGPPQRRG